MSFATPSPRPCPDGRWWACPCQASVAVGWQFDDLVKALGPMPAWPDDDPA